MLVALAAGGAHAQTLRPARLAAPQTPRVEAARQLMITDLSVVEDPARTRARPGHVAPWSFAHLMRSMAGRHDPAAFTMRWLRQWERDYALNGYTAAARPKIRELVIEPWLRASGGRRLDLDRAPFKLLAIVNRMDLRQHEGASVSTAGEGRFVFGVLGPDGKPLPPIAGTAPGGFVVIFEYELVARDMAGLRDWTRLWMDLGRQRLGTAEYNRALEGITRRFTDAGRAPGKVNGNALNQIRTNEISLGLPWELREFTLDAAAGLLAPHTVALSPDMASLNGTEALASLINDHEAEILAGTFDFPEEMAAATSPSGPFQLSDFPDAEDRTFTVVPFFPPFVDLPWSADGIRNNDARQAFALNTCGGCHRVETGADFVQVGFPADHRLPASLGKPASLAGFLTGTTVPDPVDPSTTRTFGDLERRRLDLEALAAGLARPGAPRPHRPRFVH